MRSLLFVPGDSERKLEKALASGADVLILDLEDSVAPTAKPRARQISAEFLRSCAGKPSPALYVRVNDLASGLTDDDLTEVVSAAPAGIMLPKADNADDVTLLSARLRVFEAENGFGDGATMILPIITETPAGVLAAHTHARSNPRLSGLTWGAEDLSAAIGARSPRDEEGCYTAVFQHARTVTLLAAAAAGVAPVDTVFPEFRDETSFRRECIAAERDGFTAKMAIHPAQVPIINEVFTPSAEAVAHARSVITAFSEAGGAGVVAIGGKMYDRPHLKLAERLLARASTKQA
ncbi:MAG TPA: CoA ester lyase [Erythrobacter sp.]|nr:CoA ester lyase [Erythrobacter sp.]